MMRAADRILGIALLGLAAFVAVQAQSFYVPFSYDPVGPKAFPVGLAIILALLSLVLILRPGPNGQWPSAATCCRLVGVLVIMGVYALLFTRLGYTLSTGLAILCLARSFGASWVKALVTAVVMAVVTYFLFSDVLEISLPSGQWLTALS
ncbi:tricarboxylic transporter [Terasakiispira papahanaumokuakeensis]|uniref:Tricarboxylic transporter n=1 Tax=Terasakiispira papahanaumokuakeensis TaxID=197479 RepID=A0A1E2V5Q2_9GAMM|nr:tripartite tricarboxylate transporter TctB family protein [Terasakiispira papahanaumokuakeensis]ODC02243.1 tricarboxylic transporter [Terasakiispira papahanaumokuakeensis]